MKTRTSHSLEETQDIAKEWLVDISIKTENLDKATMVGLSGHLGAGKTAFVKLIAKMLGINENVTSPTFVIMKNYNVDQKMGYTNWKKLVHIDAYRLEKPEDLEALNFEEIILDKDNLIMIEWPENVGLKTDNQINMKAVEGEGTFEISFT